VGERFTPRDRPDDVTSNGSGLISELRRREVLRVAAAYIVAGAVVAGAANDILPNLGAPSWTVTLVIVVLLAGLPIALVLAWFFQVKPEGPPVSQLARDGSDGSRDGIAVLPFENLSPDPNDAYFSDGLTEEIIADLSVSRSLRVISRSSVMALKGTKKTVREIANELGVQYVLEGSVRKAGDSLRITAQLIDAEADHHLWGEKYDGALDDIFSIQESVSRAIVDALRLTLTPLEEGRISRRPVADVRAYDLSMKARQRIYSFRKEEMEQARRDLEEALGIAGENAYLFYLLAHLHYQFWNAGIRLVEEDLARARTYADKALLLDPRSPDYLVIRGLLEVTGGNAVTGYRYFEAALERDPHHADALFWSPGISAFLGRDVEAKRRLEQLRRVDPLNPFASIFEVWTELKKARFTAALELARELRKTINEPLLEGAYALALGQAGRPDEAVPVLGSAFGSEVDMIARVFRAFARAFEGDRSGVLELMDADFERWAGKDFQYSEFAAQALAKVGELDRAMDWLETSVERGNINHPFLSRGDTFLEDLRRRPRFEVLMERVKREWESFEGRVEPM